LPHKPVLLKETVEGLQLKPGAIVVDGTLGGGGHAAEIIKKIGAKGRLIAIDQDPAALDRCRELFKSYKQVSFHHENFRNTNKVLEHLNVRQVNAVILDVGFSSNQIEDSERGFSFERFGPLDMRMNPQGPTRASDLLRDLSQSDLEYVFRAYGDIRGARKLAAWICEVRNKRSIETTQDLVAVIKELWPQRFRGEKGSRPPWARRHPATRVFQSLRIAVNDELNALNDALETIWPFVSIHGRLAVISFHSSEDRLVKHQFRAWHRDHQAILINKKPIGPSEEEIKDNPRSRSAKLRIVEKKHEGNG